MSEWTALAVTELLLDKPFTHPSCTQDDLRILQFGVEQLRLLLENTALVVPTVEYEQLFWVEIDGRLHRLVVRDAGGLRTDSPLTLVGFFGQRRQTTDPEAIDQVDTELITELLAHPGLLAYCTIAIDDNVYGNLVLFRDEGAKLHWSNSERHGYAVRVLSPKHYESVRLHNGRLPGGLYSSQPLLLERTKYLDYRGMLPWRGIREWA